MSPLSILGVKGHYFAWPFVNGSLVHGDSTYGVPKAYMGIQSKSFSHNYYT